MATKPKIKQPANKYYLLWLIGISFYFWISFTTPLKPNKYHLTLLSTQLIKLSILIPFALIWLAAYYGAIRFKNYSKSIQDSPDGAALNKVSNGLLILANGLLVSSIFSAFREHYGNPANYQNFTILSNWLALLFPGLAFIVLFLGAQQLIKLVQPSRRLFTVSSMLTLIIGIAAGVYTYAMFHNPYRNTTLDHTVHASFYLSDTMLLTTIVIPSILIWIFATQATYLIHYYAQRIKGVIYKDALSRLTTGLVWVVVVSVAFSMLSTIGSIFEDLSLSTILIILYVIIVLYGVGYLVIASGAKKLAKIEEV